MIPEIQLIDGMLLLRPPRVGDMPAIHAAVLESLPELHPWMDWATEAFTEAATLRWLEHYQQAWENSTAFQFVIIDYSSLGYLGGCGVDGINQKNGTCNLGYWVRTSRAGYGIASRAVRLAARFSFEHLGLLRAEIMIAASNLASQRAAQKAGAHFDQILKDHLVVRTEVHDAHLYSLTPADFKDQS